jgi:hypothetical protein
MVAYEIYWLDPKGGHQIIGVLPEKRKNPMRITRESVMNWGKMLLGNDVDSKNIFFRRVTIDSLADRILWHDLSNLAINIIS